ncbi:MAG: transglycosylase SLT domain-containing protein [Xanthobacteraceae bacterium]
MNSFRSIVVAALGLVVVTAQVAAARSSEPVPLPRERPAGKSAKSEQARSARAGPQQSTTTRTAPLSLTPEGETTAAASAPGGASGVQPPASVKSAVSPRLAAPFAAAATTATSPLDLSAAKQALDLVRKNRQDEATTAAGSITDPLARKLVEWAILRSEDGSTDFWRYSAFINANPSWPSIPLLRRRAEAALWQERTDPQAVIAFFANYPPRSAKGHFALARALLTRGDSARASAILHEAWRSDAFSSDLEGQARETFGGLITPADDAARMDTRLYAEDEDAALRAARHLDATAMAVAKARIAVIDQAGNAKALLEAVPESARREPGYLFSRIQWLRRSDKIVEAAQLLVAAPRDPARLGDVDQWWVERRLVARKLLDRGDARLAYEVANTAAVPKDENHRGEQHFTAGWIALRFLREPNAALPHFARIAEGVTNPITLARAFYWQGRAAEALGREQDARSFYQQAAYPTAYYGQLARAKLGLNEVTLRMPPESAPEHRTLEIARVFEILYAIDERDMIAAIAADLGENATDTAALTGFANIAARHHDARATLLIGKAALRRGLPFERYAFPDFGVPEYQQIGPQVEACVVYGIVRQESAFNPRVVSSANAIGLMQVTPAAGRDTAKRFNVTFDQSRLSQDVAYNAQLGTAELGNDIASWRGSYILAFVAYNAGPRRAKEWIEQYGDPRDPKIDPIDWIERIPISETRNYVQRVLENMQVYRTLLENNPKLLIEADLHRGG